MRWWKEKGLNLEDAGGEDHVVLIILPSASENAGSEA